MVPVNGFGLELLHVAEFGPTTQLADAETGTSTKHMPETAFHRSLCSWPDRAGLSDKVASIGEGSLNSPAVWKRLAIGEASQDRAMRTLQVETFSIQAGRH